MADQGFQARGLTWVHLKRPDAAAAHDLAERFGWHELDVEDVLSKRQRPKVDEYPEYLFGSSSTSPSTTRRSSG